MLKKLAQIRKALVAVAGVAAQVVALGVVHGTALHYVQLALGVLAAAGVYAVPNGKKPVALADVESALKTLTAAGTSAQQATEQVAQTISDTAKPTSSPKTA